MGIFLRRWAHKQLIRVYDTKNPIKSRRHRIQDPTWVSSLRGLWLLLISCSARQQFGNLQHRTFPIYFISSISLSSVMLGLWAYFHPTVLNELTSPFNVDVAQFYTIASVLLFQGLNYFVVGPLTSKYVSRLPFVWITQTQIHISKDDVSTT